MLPKLLMLASTGVVLTLGILHLAYTFTGPKLAPRDPAVLEAMKQSHPGISKQTTMWRVWVGVNATHSLALILFGLIYAYLALAQTELLFGSPFLLGVGFATLAGLLAVCRLYFFDAPVLGIAISLACYVASIVLARL